MLKYDCEGEEEAISFTFYPCHGGLTCTQNVLATVYVYTIPILW